MVEIVLGDIVAVLGAMFLILLTGILVFFGLAIYLLGGTLLGGLFGWILTFTPISGWIAETLNAFGIYGINTIHLGVTLGFISDMCFRGGYKSETFAYTLKKVKKKGK